MKKIRFWSIFFLIPFCILSCKDDNTEMDIKTVLELNYDSLYFSFSDRQASIEITVNKEWSVEGVPEWVQIDPMRGVKGTHTLNINVVPNPEIAQRKAVFNVIAGDAKKTVTVLQTEKAVIVIGEKNVQLPANVTEWEVTVGTNVPIEMDILGDVKWLSKVESRAVMNRTFKFSLTSNLTEEARVAKIVFRNTQLQLTDTVILTHLPIAVLNLKNSYNAVYNQTRLAIPIKTNLDMEVVLATDQSWLKRVESKAVEEKSLSFSLEPNNSGKVRTTTVLIKNDKNSISFPVTIKQGIHWKDGDVITVQKATKGKGIDLILMGDGYTQAEIDSMEYMDLLDLGVKHFFDVEPFTTYREYFNIYQVVVVSNESGMSNSGRWPGINQANFDTRLKARQNGNGADVDLNICKEYAAKARINSQVDEYMTVVVGNFPYYCGSTYIGKECVAVFSASTQPSPQNYKELMQHEAGGHGIGWLADEYVANTAVIPDKEVDYGLQMQGKGAYQNVVFFNFSLMAPWAAFIGHPKYPEVGMYEGGWTWGVGVWRSTKTSIMRDMIGVFNVASRYAIVERITWLAGETLTMEDFIANDKLAGTGTKQLQNVVMKRMAPHLPPPIWIGN